VGDRGGGGVSRWVGKVLKKQKNRWGARVGSITYLLEFGRVLHSPSKT